MPTDVRYAAKTEVKINVLIWCGFGSEVRMTSSRQK
jgi:hypothetical protein